MCSLMCQKGLAWEVKTLIQKLSDFLPSYILSVTETVTHSKHIHENSPQLHVAM